MLQCCKESSTRIENTVTFRKILAFHTIPLEVLGPKRIHIFENRMRFSENHAILFQIARFLVELNFLVKLI